MNDTLYAPFVRFHLSKDVLHDYITYQSPYHLSLLN